MGLIGYIGKQAERVQKIAQAAQVVEFDTSDMGSFMSAFFGRNLDKSKGALLRKYEGYVYACVSAIAEEVADIEFQMLQVDKDGNEVVMQKHKFLDLLNEPDPQTNKYDLIELTQTHIELAGEAFWQYELGENTDLPMRIKLLPPDRMAVAVNEETGLVIGYTFDDGKGNKVPFEVSEIEHFKMPCPWDKYRGYGTVEAAIVEIATHRASSEFTRNYLDNGAMPGGVLNLKRKLGKEAFEKVKREWKEEYGSVRNAGKTVVFNDQEAEFIKVGSSLNEIGLKELKDMTREDIMLMFRVPKPLLGMSGDVNRASAFVLRQEFARSVVDKKMARITNTLQEVASRYADFYNKRRVNKLEFKLTYVSPVPEDQEEKLSYYKAAGSTDFGWMTVNEIRDKEGLEPVPGGDVIRRPTQSAPIGEPVDPKTGTTAKGKPRRKAAKSKKKEPKRALALPSDEQMEVWRKGLYTDQDQYEEQLLKDVRKHDQRQKQLVLANTKDLVKKAKDAYNDVLFDAEEEAALLLALLLPTVYQLYRHQGKNALQFIGDHGDVVMPETSKAELNNRLARMSRDYTIATRTELEQAITQAIANQETPEQLAKRIEHIYGQNEKWKALRVARTELSKASHLAIIDAWAQNGSVKYKEWFVHPGACPFCTETAKSANRIGLRENFYVVGQSISVDVAGKENPAVYNVTYEDIGGPPLHPNCRCTLRPVY